MLTDVAREDAATAVGITHIGLATAYPGATGASNELSAGSYARVAKTVSVSTAGVISAPGPIAFTVSENVEYLVAFNHESAGEPKGFCAAGGSEKLYAVDPVTNVFRSPSHGLVDDDLCVFYTIVPSPLVAGTKYHVVSATTDTLQVSASQGGSAIDITAAPSDPTRARLSKIVPDTGSPDRSVQFGTATFTLS
jgi:hypothetical protein